MGRFDLNLSTRPFPAHRATNLAMAAFLIVLGFVSVWQTYSFIRYSSLAASIRDEERNVRVGAEVLKDRTQEFESRLDQPEVAAKLAEIDFFNSLIDRRQLSWTRVFGTLEDIVPNSVRLISLTPQFADDGSILFQISVRARSIEDVSEFITAMESSPTFNRVTVAQETKTESGDVDVTLDVTYLPEEEIQ